MEIYIIRRTAVAVENDICYGQTDVELAADYLYHITAVKNKLPQYFDKIYSSPLKRCRILANQLNTKEMDCHKGLMEMNFGDWEKQSWRSLESPEFNHWMENFVTVNTPNGESLTTLYQRVEAFIDRPRIQDHQQVAIVTHAGVIRCIWAYILDIPLENIFKVPVDYGQGLVVTLDESRSLDRIVNTHL